MPQNCQVISCILMLMLVNNAKSGKNVCWKYGSALFKIKYEDIMGGILNFPHAKIT